MISVVVPIYNSADTIAACIESILRQTVTDLELLLIDDGSTDDTADIIDSYAKKDHRIIAVHQPNKGRTEARAEGVRRAKGEWVSFVDSDDTLPADSLERLSAKATDKVDMVLGNGHTLPGEQRPLIPMSDFRHMAVRAEGTIGVPWGSLYRRKVLTPWLFDIPRHIVNGEDYLFWLRLVFNTEKPVAVVYESVYCKGDEHTSNSFKWTAGYCQELNELRRLSIPESVRSDYASDMLSDRLDNMFAVATWQRRQEWTDSPYYRSIVSDAERLNRPLTLKQRLFFALPSLRLRRLLPRLSVYHAFLAVVGVVMLCMNLLDAPTLSDDMIYRFMWHEDESAPVETISSLTDLLQSQWAHYLTTNGRWVVHLLAQAFLVFVSPVVLQVLNTLLFVLLLHLTVRWTTDGNRLFAAVIVFFLLFAVFQGLRTTMLWSLGTFNYLWPLVATLGLLLWLRKRSRCTPWLAPLAFFIGCSHEALSLPLSFGFFVYLIVNRRQASVRRIVPYVLCYWLGTMTILFSPGVWNRTTEGVSLMSRLLSGTVNLAFNMRVFWLLAIALLVLWRRKRAFLNAHLRDNLSAYTALVLSFVIVVLCGTNLERVCFFTDFIAMLLLLRILTATTGPRWRKGLMVAACLLTVVLMIPAYQVRQENYELWQQAERQMQEPGRELIAVRCVPTGDGALMDYFRSHYVNPSIEFGFYCSYMAFDACDINMRCAARLYGKNRLTFLPEDVVQRIEADSTAYADYALSADGSLYVWRLDDERDVAAVTFVLNPEDVSELLPHQRLLAYRDDTYELDDFHYEAVRVGGRRYLVFTRPTTNIVRRLNHIELTYDYINNELNELHELNE